VSVEISSPLTSNKPFKASWVGPGKPNDQIVIVPSGAEYWQMFESAKVTQGNPRYADSARQSSQLRFALFERLVWFY